VVLNEATYFFYVCFAPMYYEVKIS